MTTAQPNKSAGIIVLGDGACVWSDITVTMPVRDITFEFRFGHSRATKSSATTEVRKASNLIDEFNEAELTKRLEKYARLIRRITNDVAGGDDDEDDTKPTGTARERAAARKASGR